MTGTSRLSRDSAKARRRRCGRASSIEVVIHSRLRMLRCGMSGMASQWFKLLRYLTCWGRSPEIGDPPPPPPLAMLIGGSPSECVCGWHLCAHDLSRMSVPISGCWKWLGGGLSRPEALVPISRCRIILAPSGRLDGVIRSGAARLGTWRPVPARYLVLLWSVRDVIPNTRRRAHWWWGDDGCVLWQQSRVCIARDPCSEPLLSFCSSSSR